jgi:hypothetical protein
MGKGSCCRQPEHINHDDVKYVAINNCFEKGAAVNLESALKNGSYGNDLSVNLQGGLFPKTTVYSEGFLQHPTNFRRRSGDAGGPRSCGYDRQAGGEYLITVENYMPCVPNATMKARAEIFYRAI